MKTGRSWKTTSIAILAVVGALVRFTFAIKSGDFSEESIMTMVSALVTGAGFFFAKDSNVTGGTVVSVKDQTGIDTTTAPPPVDDKKAG